MYLTPRAFFVMGSIRTLVTWEFIAICNVNHKIHLSHFSIIKQTNNKLVLWIISGFCRRVNEVCALVGYYAANNINSLLTFRDNLWVPSSRCKNPGNFWPVNMGPIVCCPETLVRNHHYTLQRIADERRSQTYVSLIIHSLHARGTVVRYWYM